MAGFFYGQDHEELLIRLKDGYDGSQPSENSMAALRMLKLAKLTSDYKLEEKVEQIFQAFASEVGSYPTGFSYFMKAYLTTQMDMKEVVVITNDFVDRFAKWNQHEFLPEVLSGG